MTSSTRARVVMLLANNPYPQDSRVSKEAVALVRAGYRVSVVAVRASGQPAHELIDGVRVHRYRVPGEAEGPFGYVFEYGYTTIASFVVSLRLLFRGGFDILHLNNPPDTLGAVGLFYKLLGKRIVYDHHDLAPEMYRERFAGRSSALVYRVLLLLEKVCCRVADVVIATNESYKQVEIERDGVEPRRIEVVRNGPLEVLLEQHVPDTSARDGADAVVGYVGVIGYQDGLDYLLRAVRHLVVDLGRTRVRCVIVGYGDALEDMKRLACELGINGHVVFTGELRGAALYSTLAATDVCAVPDPSNPYNDRSTMVKMMEYMALGKPIVAFDLPEHRVSAEDAAVYVRPNDERAFAEAIARLFDDPARRNTLGALGRSRVGDTLLWKHSVPRLLAAYSRAVRS